MKAETTVKPDKSWLSGTWNTRYGEAVISTAYSYVSLPQFFNGEELFAQGDHAESIIEDIHQYWVAGNLTQIQAIEKYINNYGY
jgi:hypothetical protein